MKTLIKKKLLKVSFCLTAIICLISKSHAQGPLQWIQQYERPGATGSAQFVESTDVAYTAGGSAIVGGAVKENTGTTLTGNTDAAVVKFSPSGAVLNSFFYDYNSGGTDKTIRVIVNGTVVYALIKGQYNVSPSFDYDFKIVKFDTNLVVTGSTFYNGTASMNDIPTDMGMDAAGNIYVIGTTQRTATGLDAVLIKYNAALIPQYTKFYSSAGVADDVATALKVEASGTCDITGYTTTSAYGQRLLVLKYFGNGTLLWKKFYDANNSTTNVDQGKAISYDPGTGDVYVTGMGYTSSNSDWVVAKYSGTDGTRLWVKKYAGPDNNNDAGADISWFSSSALYVCGKYRSTVSGITEPSIQLRKLNPADGSPVWTKAYIGPPASGPTTPVGAFVSSMLVTPSENIYVLGTAGRQTPTYIEANHLILNYTSSGALTWSDLRSSGSVSGFQSYNAVKAAYIPASQVLYVAGTKNLTMSFIGNWSIAKYSPITIAQTSFEEKNSLLSAPVSGSLKVSVYPNPFMDMLNIEAMDDVKVQDISVVDMLGQIVFQSNIQQLPLQINTSKFAKGVYQLIIHTSNGKAIHRIVKE